MKRPGFRNRRIVALLGAGLLLCPSATTAKEPYNVLLIIADDLNSRIAPLGDPQAITPHLTRLAERSVTYRNCSSQYAFCAPSRGSFLTGLYPWNLGVHAAGGNRANGENIVPGRPRMSQYFQSQGYWTGSYGKVEHYERSERWDELIPRTTGIDGSPRSIQSFTGHKGISGDTSFVIYEDGDPASFTDGLTATGALGAMEKCLERNERFFVAAGFFMPHTPWLVPSSIADLHDPRDFVLPESPPGSYDNAYWPPYAYTYGKASDTRPYLTEAELRSLFHAYYSAVTLMDHSLGRLLDFADSRNLWDNTVIAFVSDNGFSLMEHRHLYAKRNYSREAIHVPMMIHHPGMRSEGRFCDRQVGLIDLMPTLFELAGVDPYPRHLDGQSLAPLQENPDMEWETPALSCLTYPNNSEPRFRIGQVGQWKLVEGPFSASYRRVMNHDADPFEHFGSFPNNITPADLRSLEEGVAEIPFRENVFYVDKPDLGQTDRDEDGLPDEVEIDLLPLGFHPFEDNRTQLRSLSNSAVELKSVLEGVTLTFPALRAEPRYFRPWHTYPLSLQRSPDLSTWEGMPGNFRLDSSGALQWLDQSGTILDKAFYRLRIQP